jgi:hypothetical protein
LRAALLVVLFAISSSFASHAVASANPSLAEQIALAVIDGIQASDMTDEQKNAAIAEVAAVAALDDPSAANALGAAIADKYPARASSVATAIIDTLNAAGKSSYVSRQTMASLATNNTAISNLSITDTSWDQNRSNSVIAINSESTVNNPELFTSVIIANMDTALAGCASAANPASCQQNAINTATGQVASSTYAANPALAAAMTQAIILSASPN